MNKTPILLLLVLLRVAAIAQPIQTLGNNPAAQINNYAVLPDHGYSFNTICTDTTLPFIINDSLRPGKAVSYWLKIIIDNPSRQFPTRCLVPGYILMECQPGMALMTCFCT